MEVLLSSETWSTSARSWSSLASQKMGTCSTPVAAVACLARATAVAALSNVSRGPPNSPTCWPVTTPRAPLRSLAMLARVAGLSPKGDALAFPAPRQVRQPFSGEQLGRIHARPSGAPIRTTAQRRPGAVAHCEVVAEELRRVRQRRNVDNTQLLIKILVREPKSFDQIELGQCDTTPFPQLEHAFNWMRYLPPRCRMTVRPMAAKSTPAQKVSVLQQKQSLRETCRRENRDRGQARR